MTIDLTTLPARLRGKRGERTLYAVSVETGISVPTLSRIERGSLPQGTTLAALEQWLDGYELGEPDVPVLHVAIDRGVDELRRQLHVAVQSWQDVHRQNQELQALVNQQRKEVERLQQENTERYAALESYRTLARGRIAELEAGVDRQQRQYDDLSADFGVAERAVQNTREVLCRAESLFIEAKADPTEPTLLGSQAARVVARLERAESECGRLRAGIALARTYKVAVDSLNGVADAEASLFAWLEEMEEDHGKEEDLHT